MGTIQVPGRISGKTYTIGIKGDTPSETEQARIRAFLEERESQFAADYEARYGAPLAVEDGVALGRGWEVGKAGAYSRLGTATEYLGRGLGLESLTGVGQRMREEGDYEGFLESLRQPAPTTLQDVTGIGSALTYLGEGIGQSGPEMLAPLAATGIGTLAGTAATGNPFTGGAIGLGAGAVTAFPSFFGGNIQRQEAEVAAGRKDEVDVTNAIVGAVGQSTLNAIGDKLLLGGFLKPGQKWLTRTAVGAAEGAAVEIPTEIAQQIIERKQAGLPLDSDDAINEYINAGILGGVMGGGIRGATAGLGIGIERPAAPPATTPPATTLGLPAPPRPGVATVSGTRRVKSGGVPVNTVVGLSDGSSLTLEGDATEADIARAVDQYNQTKAVVAEKAPAASKTLKPTTSVEDIPEAELVSTVDTRIGAGTTVDEDLAEARKIYDDAVEFALDLGTDPEKAKQLAAQQTVNYVDSLQEETRKRLERFRNTMARVASPTAAPAPAPSSKSVRGVMQPDLPDSAYASEFGETVQKDLFAPSPAAPKVADPKAPAAPQGEALIGTDAGNGFLHGRDGERYRVSESSVYGGQSSPAVALEKRLSGGTAATFLVGKDGKLIDADTVALNKPEQRERVWTSNDAQKRARVSALLGKAAQLPLGSPERNALLEQVREIVTGSEGSQRAPQQGEAPAAPKAPAAPTIPAGPATWRSKDYDYPVEVMAEPAQAAPDGRFYQKVRTPDGMEAFVPADELRPAAPKAPTPDASQFSEAQIAEEINDIRIFNADFGITSTDEEVRKDAIANLQRRAGAPADQEPIFGEEWMEAARKQAEQPKPSGPLVVDPFKNSTDPRAAILSDIFAKLRPADPNAPAAAGAEPDTLSASDLPADPDKPSLPDTRGKGVRFHGSTSEISQVEDGYVGSDRNFYGQGFYTSDAVAITDGYSKAKGAKDGAVYRVDEIGPVNALDMEQPVPDWLISDYASGRSPEAEGIYDLVLDAIEEMQGPNYPAGSAMNVREFYDLIRDISAREAIPTYEVQEYFDALSEIVMGRGFNALDHIGGLRTKKAPHSVRIYLAPKNTVRITKVDPKNPDMTPSAEMPKAAGAAPAARAEPDTLSQLEGQLAAARARAAELRKKVPAGVLQREFTGGEVDPALVKRVENLQNNLNRQQIAADKARDAVPKKPTHPARPKKLAQYEEALAKVKETQEQLAVAQDALGTAELAANLRRGAQPKTQLQGKAKSAYTAYFNALQDADTLRKTLESERARSVVAPEQRPALPSLRGDILPELNVVYPAGGTRGLGQAVPSLRDPVIAEAPLAMLGQRKVAPPTSVTWKVAEDVRRANIRERFAKFFAESAPRDLVRYTTARGGFNNETTWKNFPDWMPAKDQLRILQLLGRPTREQRTKYKITEEESPRLTDEESAARTYFAKMLRPVDAIDLMLADLSVYYESYKGTPGQTDAGLHALLLGTGSDPAKLALNWVRANLSPETNAELDLILKKQADDNARLERFIGTEGTDRVAGGRAARDAARKAARSAAEDSGYDAGSIVRRMAAGDSRVALDQEMHYSVKAALNAGDLKGALRALADTTSNPELKDLANRFAGLVGTTRVRILYPGDSAKYIGNDRGVYVQQPAGVDPDYENIILINGQTGMTNHVLMHEMAHAVSAKFTTANPNHPVVRQLEALLNELRSRGPKRDWYTDGRVKAFTYPNDFYGLTNISEMVAEGYGRLALGETDNGLRDLMKRTTLPVELKVEFENPLTAWERFKEIIANILNAAMGKPLTRRPRTKRTETIQGYESAEARFHKLVDGLLSEAPQVLPDSVLQNAVVNPMVGRNVLNNAVLGAPVWTPAGMSRLGQLMMTAVPKGLKTALLGLLQLEWFNDLAGKYYSEIGKLQTVDELRRGKIERTNDSAKPVIEDNLAYAKKSPEMYALATSVYGQATMLGVDPTAPQSKYAADKEKLAEWHNLNRQLDQDRSGEARRLFSKTKALKESFREEIKRVLKGRALDITGDETKANNLVAQLLKKLDDENAIEPYFALMREGDYWMSYTAEDTTAAPVAVGPLGQMKRPTTRYVQAFESPFDRAAARAKLEAAKDANGDRVAWDFKETMNPISEAPKGGQAPTALVQGALNIISGFGGQGATDAEKARVQAATEAIQELFVRLSPGHSLMKSMLKRKGTRGFLGDIGPIGVIGEPVEYVDALATKVNSLAYQLANIEFGGQIQKLMNSALETRNKLQDSESLTSAEKAAADAYYDEFQMRAQFAKSPQVSKAAQATRGVTFGWTLGGLLAGGLNNLAQLPMIAVPELAGRYSLPGTMRELGFAMRALSNAGKTQRVLSYGVDGREARTLNSVDNFGSIANYFEPNADGTLSLRTDINIPAELRDKIANLDVLADEMSKHGMLSASMTREMLESETNWLHKINRWGGFFMHQAERFNRQTVAVIAYNLELGKLDGPATPEAKRLAAKKAMEITGKVNGAIGASTAPRWAMGAVGSVVFMFKRFGLQMARYIINATLASLKRIDPNMSEADIAEAKKERAVARYQLTGVLGATALLAGVQGLPFFSEVMSLINLFFTDDDEERAEVLVQKFLGEPYYHGALNYLLGIEVASRISLSGLIFRENKIEKDQSVYYDLIEMFGGPAVGVALNFERGWNLIGEGEVYRGLEAMSPAALKALMKAGRFGTDGATTLRGDEIIPLTPIDIVRQGLGYTPGVYARQQERVSGAKRIDEAVREKKRKLLRKFNVAYREGDFVTVREVLKEMREFGRKYPEEQILPETIEKSRRSFEQRSQEMISGVSFTNSGRTRADKSFEEFDEDVTFWASLTN